MEKIDYPKEINSFFTEVIERIKFKLDPDFILISGSFGKGTWLFHKEQLLSDFEFVFVCKKRWPLNKKKELLNLLNKEFSYEISLKGYLLENIYNKVSSNYSSRNQGYMSLDFYDTFSNPNILYSKNSELIEVEVNPFELNIWEAWRLYTNRMGDILSLSVMDNVPKYLESYYWLKIFESTADIYCIINKKYKSNILWRINEFNNELIENDDELNIYCKNSFEYVNQALNARNKHDLSLFKNNLSVEKRKKMVDSWMRFIENKLSKEEGFKGNGQTHFYNNYIVGRELQKKYLGFNFKYNIFLSNLIRLIIHPNLINSFFKFYNHKVSWKHIILLTVSSTFYELSIDKENFLLSKNISSNIVSSRFLNKLNGGEFIRFVLNYWRKLR